MVSQTGESVARLYLTKNVSSNYVIGNDGTLWLTVDEDRRAHTSGSATDGGKGAAWDQRSITVEIANETGSPDWQISDAAIDTAARLFNDLRDRYPLKNILGHRDLWENWGASYPTYCPGPETVNRIYNRAMEITPQPPRIGNTLMSALFGKKSTMKLVNGVYTRTTSSVVALAGENPGAGAPNWMEFTSPAVDGGVNDLNATLYRAFGSRETALLNDSEWEFFKKNYTATSQVEVETGDLSVSVDLKPVTERMDEIIKTQKAKRVVEVSA